MQILQVWDMFTDSCFFLFAVVHMSIFPSLTSENGQSVKAVRSLQKILISISLSCVKICIYMDIVIELDCSCYFLTFGLVNCMDKKCHEIVYMKLWPNMDSKLWKCTILTDYRVYRHIPTHLCYSHPRHPLKLTKNAWPCAKPACATSDASMLRNESSDHIWAFISFVISRGLHHGLLPKRDKVAESTHTNGLVFWGSCRANCRSTTSVGSRGLLAWNVEGLSRLLPPGFLGLPLATKTRKEDQFSLLCCLSCDQVGKRFTKAGTRNSRLFFF